MSDVEGKEQKGSPMSEEEVIPQNHERGPGWFLKASYLVIAIVCLYYLFNNWNWQSDYQLQQQEIKSKISQTG